MQHFLTSMQDRTARRSASATRGFYTLKYARRSLRRRASACGVTGFCVRDAAHARHAGPRPAPGRTPRHAYISRRLGAAAGYAIIRSHYTLVLTHLPLACSRRSRSSRHADPEGRQETGHRAAPPNWPQPRRRTHGVRQAQRGARHCPGRHKHRSAFRKREALRVVATRWLPDALELSCRPHRLRPTFTLVWAAAPT